MQNRLRTYPCDYHSLAKEKGNDDRGSLSLNNGTVACMYISQGLKRWLMGLHALEVY
jgi:hypothetical protein